MSAAKSVEKAYEKWLSGETSIYNGQAKRTGRDKTGLTAKQRARKERDQLILEMHEQGLSNREIADIFRISPQTVTNALQHLSNF